MEIYIKKEHEDEHFYSEEANISGLNFVVPSRSCESVHDKTCSDIDLNNIKKEKVHIKTENEFFITSNFTCDEDNYVNDSNSIGLQNVDGTKQQVFNYLDIKKILPFLKQGIPPKIQLRHLKYVRTCSVLTEQVLSIDSYALRSLKCAGNIFHTFSEPLMVQENSELKVFDGIISEHSHPSLIDARGENMCMNTSTVSVSETSSSRGSCFCVQCKKQFDNQESYDEHMIAHNPQIITIKKLHECNDCEEGFCKKEILNKHERDHSEKKSNKNNHCSKDLSPLENAKDFVSLQASVKPFKCSTCNKQFTNSSNLKRHMQLHTGQKPFICSLCNKGFRERNSLKNHMPMHFKEKRIKCEFCNKLFFHENYLQKHMVVHKKKRKNKTKVSENDAENSSRCKDLSNHVLFCSHCKIQFEKEEDYAIHVISHNPQTTKHKKTCNVCGGEFHSMKTLEKHMEIHRSEGKSESTKFTEELTLVKNLKLHKDKDTGSLSFICKICNEVFDRSYKLRDHMNVHDTDKSYKCNECGRKFASIPYLRKHSVIHASERPHQCGICNRGFHRRSNLEIHMRTHFDDRPYKCTKCDKSFTSLSGLNRHNKIHDGPYDCPVCNKKFNSESLKIHMLLHTGEKSFACHICNKRFAVSSYLKVHIRVKHTGERPYECPKCDKNYTQSAHLRSHMKTHHRSELPIKQEQNSN